MPGRREIWALRVELGGLLVLLLGGVWQSQVAGWWEMQASEWYWWIQEEVNLALLMGGRDLVTLSSPHLEDETRDLVEARAQDRFQEAYLGAIEERDRRLETLSKGQAAWMLGLRNALLALGAGLLVLGKWLTLREVRARVQTRELQ